MSLTLNHNMMAYNTHRRLSMSLARLGQNTQRLASGLKINGPGDGPAAFAVREMMRTDMNTLQQGLRNAADGVSLLQTAEGAMAIIDEKLFRMKELAEQAATGTYTTLQREIINSEYQAMAAEIDRIANATNFNGVKLLDGSISDVHRGLGLKIHFGLTNNPTEDYHFVNIGDVRATTATGLRVAGDARNDIWSNASYVDNFMAEACCGGGVTSLNEPVNGWRAGDVFSFGYNWDMTASSEEALSRGRYIAGAWAADGEDFTLGQLLDKVNRGTQARVRVDIKHDDTRYVVSSGGHTIDITAYYNPAVNSLCPRGNRVISDTIPVAVANSPSPPVVCYGDEIWPPADLFYYSLSGGTGSWMAAPGRTVTFSGFTAAVFDGVSPSYTISYTNSSGATVITTVNMSAAVTVGGTGLTWNNLGHWEASGVSIGVTPRPEVLPEFRLPDGQLVPAYLVEGDSLTGFSLKIGLLVNERLGVTLDDLVEGNSAAHAFQWSFGNEIYFYGSASLVQARLYGEGFSLTRVSPNGEWQSPVSALVAAINGNANSSFWARVEDIPGFYRDGYTTVYVFCKEGGDRCLDTYDKALGLEGDSRRVEDLVLWFNDETGESSNHGAVFNNGGKYWGFMKAQPNGYGSWSVELKGRDLGLGRDIRILNMGTDLNLGALAGQGFGLRADGRPAENLNGLGSAGFVEVQNADDGDWPGAHLRTQSHAQEALPALTAAIERKEKIRTALGAYMNRLENTMNKMEISIENLQRAESFISDVDVAREMTDYLKNQLLTQTGISLLSQVNNLPQMALALLNG